MGARPKQCRKCGSTDIPEHRLEKCDYLCRLCNRTKQNIWRTSHAGRAQGRRYYASDQGKCIVRDSIHRYHQTDKGKRAREIAQKNWRQSGGATAYRRGCTRADVARCRTSRCCICNVAPWISLRYLQRPIEVGHIIPGDTSAGFEPMCRKCNRFLGTRALTEKTGREVLRRARRWWMLKFNDRLWLHTDVDARGYGIGGVSETPGRRRILDGFEDQRRTGTD